MTTLSVSNPTEGTLLKLDQSNFLKSFSSSDKLYAVEYDQQSKTVDFVSKKKTVRRTKQSVISFKHVVSGDQDKLKFSSAVYDNFNVDESWVNDNLSKLAKSQQDGKLSIDTTYDDKENSNPQQLSQLSVVTPVEDGIKKRKVSASTPHTAHKNGRSAAVPHCDMSLAVAEELVGLFFTSDLTPYINEGSITMHQNESNRAIIADRNKFKPILVSIEGNIGAGKSFLLAQLREAHPEWVFIDEPVEFWESLKNEQDESLLQVFYKNQRRWSYTFQNCALLSRYQNIETCIGGKRAVYEKMLQDESNSSTDIKDEQCKVFITERCLDTDREVFAKMLHSDGQLDSLEMDLYNRWFNMLQTNSTQLGAIVYVDTMPGLCSDRINLRARNGEGGIPLEYLNNLDTFQNKWIDTTEVPVVRTLSDDLPKVEKFVADLIDKARSS